MILADPRFVDPARGDYGLRAGSPAIDYAPTSAARALSARSNGKRSRRSSPRSISAWFDGIALALDDGRIFANGFE